MRASTPISLTFALALLLAAAPLRAGAQEAGGAQSPPEPAGPTLSPAPGPEHPPRLTLDLPFHLALATSMGALAGGAQLLADRLAPPACRWCDPPQIDRWARRELLWKDVKQAALIGNVLLLAVPAGTALTLGVLAGVDGASFREGAEDLLVMTEAVALTMVVMQVAKFTTGRTRPDAWAGSGSTTANSRSSFFAGHGAAAFAVAAGATQVARMRGRPGWKWLAVVSFTAAAATGWLRIASDNHWLTDVVAGAAVGTAAGLALPLLVLHPAGSRAGAVTLVPAPGGIALIF
jgi:membrane-associated phospholipid phosphatase